MTPFVYPDRPHFRRHGPKGYARHDGYRPWLRDEFSFHCVYCLTREQWNKGQYGFTVDHVIPQATDPSHALDYDNLVYACFTCNVLKSDVDDVPDPCKVGFGDLVRVLDDGSIQALSDGGQFLIDVLRLDNRENTEYRRRKLKLIRLLESGRENQPRSEELYLELMRFPDDLPDLASRRPPGGNSKPDGVRRSFFAKQQKGELPQTY